MRRQVVAPVRASSRSTCGVRRLQREPGTQRLEPQVILLVDHHADPVLDQHRGARPDRRRRRPAPPAPCSPGAARAAAAGRSAPAGPAGTRRARREQTVSAAARLAPAARIASRSRRGRVRAERVARQVPRQPDPGREHEVARGPAGVEPAHAAVGQQRQVDHSSTRIRSRSSAASSKCSVSTAAAAAPAARPRSARRSQRLRARRRVALARRAGVEPCSRRSSSRSGASKVV